MNELTALFNSIFGKRGESRPMGRPLRVGKYARQNRQCEPRASKHYRAEVEKAQNDETYRHRHYLGRSRANGGRAA